MTTTDWHGVRYLGQPGGHYESWFVRANHPSRRLAFWIRYTIFSPRGNPGAAIGELWAIVSDGETGRIRAAKSEIPIDRCRFAGQGLDVRVGDATLVPGVLKGAIDRPHRISWDLRYDGGGPPVLFLPESHYAARLPKAKAVTPRPFVRFRGHLEVDGETIEIDDWAGSENHNWGSKHTDTYAWGQVVGFDGAPDAFLELITARLKFGPVWTPPMTIVAMRIDGEDLRLNTIGQAFRARGRRDGFRWTFDSADRSGGTRVAGTIEAPPQDFVGLTYHNPPGGDHLCLNSKIARCELTVERPGRAPLGLRTAGRAAFEILTDDRSTGVPIVA